MNIFIITSSSEVVNQNLHVIEARQSRTICELEKQVVYTWYDLRLSYNF